MTECRKLISLVARNTKCYFKNKYTFLVSMITPLVLLVLFATFLHNVYYDNFTAIIAAGTDGTITVESRILEGITGAWLVSSILGVCSVTVAFCSNIIMIEDKMHGALNDFRVSPVKKTVISISYFISNFFVTFLVLAVIMLIGFIYLAIVGWYLTVGDVFMIIVDMLCNILFGTLFAGVVEIFISSQGVLQAVSTLISSMYGFICGAYMPLGQFADGLRNVLCLLPGTYGVGLLRNHFMSGYISALGGGGVPVDILEIIKDNFDANFTVFGNHVPLGAMYGILIGTCALLLGVYIAIVCIKNKKR